MVHSTFSYYLLYFSSHIKQILMVGILYLAKYMCLSSLFSTRFFLNELVEHCRLEIDKIIEEGSVKWTPKGNVMYSEFTPENDLYPEKTVLFIGGRNSFFFNHDFAKRICKNVNIKTATLQYSGFYRSGNYSELSEKSYLESVEEVYKILSEKSNVYVVGYSLGTYGAYHVSNDNSVCLIAPIFSLQRSVRELIKCSIFDLNSLMKRKRIEKVHVHCFNLDFTTPYSHLDDQFRKENVKINMHNGNHISGISNILYDQIRDYVNDN